MIAVGPLMCWNCMEDYYLEHGNLPPLGAKLKTDGTETVVTVWFGHAYCRTHALEQMKAIHDRPRELEDE